VDDVVVVGAGASGLAVAAALRRTGLEPVVLERDDEIGGTWARRYDRLRLHTVRRFSGLPFHPLPRTLPRYVPKQLYAEYLADYASRLGLSVRTGAHVSRVRPEGSGWVVELDRERLPARAVVVATGRYNEPRLPQWPGVDGFGGRLVHSSQYRSGEAFAGTKALVVGLGNTGAEIATDLLDHGASVALAVRTVPPITKREIVGIPVQLFGMALEPLPARLVDRVTGAVRRLGTGDLRPYGLGPGEWGPFTARRPPVIDVGFLRELKARRVEILPALVSLTPAGATFADGSERPFDTVVAATGFDTGLDRLLDAPDAVDERGFPRPGAHPGLFFVGFNESPRGQLYESSRASTRLARAVERYLRASS
jgi:hypothetical protein